MPQIQALAATTGFFDGVHRGHVEVLQCLKTLAQQQHLPTAVITYAPHPQSVLHNEQTIPLLTPFDEKQTLLTAQGIDFLFVLPFTAALAQCSTADFFAQYLVSQFAVRQLVVGHNQCFGSDRVNDFGRLQNIGNSLHINLLRANKVQYEEAAVSSSRIRKAISEGNVAAANAMLGYSYRLQGEVVQGKQNGRKIGFPTANLQLAADKLLPPDGVYAVQATLAGTRRSGMMNIGTNPTLGTTNPRSVEVHLFDFEQIIYGKTLSVDIITHLRREQKFASLETLQAALEQDKQRALRVLKKA
ncbi:riboflavin biosynthesis protein [Bacteroidia bacterium]|nr:riboflavin biosynthesis protein [Bacteroidia bacterium]